MNLCHVKIDNGSGELISQYLVNPFVPNAPFLYPLKTSENLTIFLGKSF